MSLTDTVGSELKIALVAGEQSGDQLGAGFMREVRSRRPGTRFFGVGGPLMRAEGLEVWASAERLAVMGLFEVLTHLPGLVSLRRELVRRFTAQRPDVFVGIDAPAFNLGLARKLHGRGIRTVQYVSPQVWAWKQERVHDIARSVDLVLCLLPFEPQFYARAGVRTAFVGHPLADQIPMEPDREAARRSLGLGTGPVVALLPGSRLGEVKRLGEDFAGAARWLHERRPELTFIAPMASPPVRKVFEEAVARAAPQLNVRVLDGQAQAALAAADAVLVASGTASLEAALSKRPMVVAYRIHPLSAWLVRRFGLMKTSYFSQPNLLAGRGLVPEFAQEEVTPQALGKALADQLDERRRAGLREAFASIHEQLRRNASASAAEAVLGLIDGNRSP